MRQNPAVCHIESSCDLGDTLVNPEPTDSNKLLPGVRTHGGVELFGIDPLNARNFFFQSTELERNKYPTKTNKINRNTFFLL